MGVYAADLVRVSTLWNEHSASSTWKAETYVTTFWLQLVHFTGNDTNWPQMVQDGADGVVSKYTAAFGSIGPLISNQVEIRAVKFAHLDTTGHTIDEGVSNVATGVLQGTSTANRLPPETTCAFSLYSYEPGTFTLHKGRKRGRFYIPGLTVGVLNVDGRISSGGVTSILNAFDTFFEGVQGMHSDPGFIGSPADYWAVSTHSAVDGTAAQVGWEAVDDKFDSQRRRQRQSAGVQQVTTLSHA